MACELFSSFVIVKYAQRAYPLIYAAQASRIERLLDDESQDDNTARQITVRMTRLPNVAPDVMHLLVNGIVLMGGARASAGGTVPPLGALRLPLACCLRRSAATDGGSSRALLGRQVARPHPPQFRLQ